jgi:hypothetical protein
MNFSLLQWVLSFVLDVLIKVTLIASLGLLVTLSGAPIIGFIFAAVLLSMFHFFCVFLTSVFVDLLDQLRVKLSRTIDFLLTLTLTNVLFVLAFAVLPRLGLKRGETVPDFADYLIIGWVLAITNVLPMLVVAGSGRIFRRR